MVMRKSLVLGVLSLLFFSIPLSAQVFRVEVAEDVPEAARAVLQQRFEQMLRSGGVGVGEDGAVLTVTADVTDRMETSGSIPQVAVVLSVKASEGDVSEEFVVKGVGADDEDAVTRAVKQILPKSKAATRFVEALKDS